MLELDHLLQRHRRMLRKHPNAAYLPHAELTRSQIRWERIRIELERIGGVPGRAVRILHPTSGRIDHQREIVVGMDFRPDRGRRVARHRARPISDSGWPDRRLPAEQAEDVAVTV